jgi:hypothetical protein
MFQQPIEFAHVHGAKDSVLVHGLQGDVVETQDRIAAVEQKPTPAVRDLAREARRTAIPCTAVRRCYELLERHLDDVPVSFVPMGHCLPLRHPMLQW